MAETMKEQCYEPRPSCIHFKFSYKQPDAVLEHGFPVYTSKHPRAKYAHTVYCLSLMAYGIAFHQYMPIPGSL